MIRLVFNSVQAHDNTRPTLMDAFAYEGSSLVPPGARWVRGYVPR